MEAVGATVPGDNDMRGRKAALARSAGSPAISLAAVWPGPSPHCREMSPRPGSRNEQYVRGKVKQLGGHDLRRRRTQPSPPARRARDRRAAVPHLTWPAQRAERHERDVPRLALGEDVQRPLVRQVEQVLHARDLGLGGVAGWGGDSQLRATRVPGSFTRGLEQGARGTNGAMSCLNSLRMADGQRRRRTSSHG